MRPSLLPGLLAAARRNMARGAERVALFEIGRRYLADAERATLGLVLAGPRGAAPLARGPAGGGRRVRRQSGSDGDPRRDRRPGRQSPGARRRFARLIIPAAPAGSAWGRRTCSPSSARCIRASLKAFDLDGAVVAAEIFLDAIPAKRGGVGHMRSAYQPPALQAVTRDFAFLVPAGFARRPAGARRQKRGQGGDHGGAPVRSVHRPGRTRGAEIACRRSDAAARREELHRGGAEGRRRADRRRRSRSSAPP